MVGRLGDPWCGATRFLVVDVKGNDLKWHYKGTRRNFSYQFRLYNKGEFGTQSSCVVANIWDWDNACKAVWYQDGKLMGDMEQFIGSAEGWKANEGAKEVKVVFTNRFGEEFQKTLTL